MPGENSGRILVFIREYGKERDRETGTIVGGDDEEG